MRSKTKQISNGVKSFLTKNSSQTKKLGRALAKKILKTRPQKEAVVIGLIGELGGGKTTFLQGFAKGLGIKEKILSPTFILMKKFQIPSSIKFLVGSQTNSKTQISKFKTFYHIDCYRIHKPKELLDLGLREIISDSQNIVAVEWADRIKKIMPKKTIYLSFQIINGYKSKRKIEQKEN